MIKILLSDGRFNIARRRLKSLAETVVANESTKKRTLNIIYCTDKLIEELNSRYLNKRRVTDVLAFSLEGKDNGDFLGEVYVNLQQARRQAADNAINYGEEVARLTVHGILHLLGYDDRLKKRRQNMWNRQEDYLSKWKK